jgi:membrane dipeptidase
MSSRKEFLVQALCLAGVSSLSGFRSNQNPDNNRVSPEYLSFDLHCHPGRLFTMGGNALGDSGDSDKTLKEMKLAGVSGAFIAMVADSKLLKPGPTGITVLGKFKEGEAWDDYKAQLKYMKAYFQKLSIREGFHAEDLKKSESMAAYISVEGGDFLEGKVENLDEAYADGIRCVQLVHYVQNNLGDLQTASKVYNGLSPFGKEVVRKMNKIGMVVDMAHASFETVKAVVDITDSPIILSHSILSMEPDRPIAQRAISKEHALMVSKTGGVVGAWPSGFNKSFDEFVDNILRMVDTIGIDHVGLGTDMDGNFKPVLSSYSQFSTLEEALKNKGLNHTEIEKIMGINALRVLKRVIH